MFVAGNPRRTGVVGKGSGSARTVETGGGSSRTSARRGPHAGIEHGGVVPQGEGGPVGSGTNPASSPRSVDAAESLRSRLTKRKIGNCPEDNLPTNQQDFLVGVEAVGVRDALDVHDMESVSLLTGLICRGASVKKSFLQPSSVAHTVQ